MRHGKKFNHLGRTASHRKAMLSNMATSLILHKRINTTVAKAKALRTYVEPFLTKSKDDTTQNRRVVFSYLQNKHAITELFKTIAPKIANRNGGYTRIIKTGFRLGDGADTALIELVDFNELYNAGESTKKTTRRSRRSTKKAEPTEEVTEVVKNEEVVAEAAPIEDAPAPAEAADTEEKTEEEGEKE
ncbi:MAG: 50S ribosomal protein L17 [Flavobacteriaceae bacterium]|jgi:large subunit ribosomal protein L17|nr:50S ribosomal protein L17 [Flavobacteriaceae bacterium]